MKTLYQLKEEGHRLLDEYASLENDPKRLDPKLAKRHAYDKLARKLKQDERKAHFGTMKTEQDVVRAISKLKKMIRSRMYKQRHYAEREKYKKILPAEELRKALNASKK